MERWREKEKRVDFTYDAAGQLATITRYSDLAGADHVVTSEYGHDEAGRLTALEYWHANENDKGREFRGHTTNY